MKKINFEDGTKVSGAKVTIDGVDYPVTPARYTGATPLSAYVMNKLQDNIENTIDQNVNNIGGKDYDATSTYDVGDIVKYQGQLYICTTAITTAEAWNSNHWQATDVLSKSEIYVGTEEPVAGEKVWFNKDENSIYVRNSNGVYEEFVKAEDEDWKNLNEDYGCYYKMIGKQVFIRAVSEKDVTLKAFAPNIIGTLPDKYKPAYQIRFNPYSKGYSTVYCEINTIGGVLLFNWDAEKTFEKGQIAFYINYYVD